MLNNKTILNKLSFPMALLFLLCQLGVNTSMAATANVSGPTPAPGRGIIPIISDHYKTMPSFYDFEQMPVEQITPAIGRRFIMGTQSMVTRWDLKAGTHLPLHFHINEQISRVDKGTLEAYSQGQKYIINTGQVMVFPPNVPHEFVALQDTILIEQFSPARQDFINGDFSKGVGKNLILQHGPLNGR